MLSMRMLSMRMPSKRMLSKRTLFAVIPSRRRGTRFPNRRHIAKQMAPPMTPGSQ